MDAKIGDMCVCRNGRIGLVEKIKTINGKETAIGRMINKTNSLFPFIISNRRWQSVNPIIINREDGWNILENLK